MAEIIHPPKRLSMKVTRTGPSPEDAIAAAEKVIENTGAVFGDLVQADIGRLDEAFAKYKEDGDRTALNAVFRIVHNMRGLGATFRYSLVTRIGTSMCRYITERKEGVELELGLLESHVDALRAVVKAHMQGEGDTVSQAVAARLEELVVEVTITGVPDATAQT